MQIVMNKISCVASFNSLDVYAVSTALRTTSVLLLGMGGMSEEATSYMVIMYTLFNCASQLNSCFAFRRSQLQNWPGDRLLLPSISFPMNNDSLIIPLFGAI
jgi:hypothetical protein